MSVSGEMYQSTSVSGIDLERLGVSLEDLDELGVLYALSDAVIVRDSNDVIVAWNSSAEAMYGWTQDEALGQKCSILLSSTKAQVVQKFFQEVMLKQHWNGELCHRRRDGEIIYVDSRCSLHTLKSNGRHVIVSIDRDVTSRKRLDEFLAMFGHELRNPISVISSAMRIGKRLGETLQGESAQVIERQTQQLSHLIDDLLDLSRINQGKIRLNLKVVEPELIVRQVVRQIAYLFRDKHHNIDFRSSASGVMLEVDPVRFEQIVGNLLNNACKYTSSEGKIVVQLQRVGQELCIRVTDNGIGISPHAISRIFDLFAQVEDRIQASNSGLGVGLTVVKRLVELHHGSISAFSEGEGKGSTFLVRLPLA